MFACFYLVASTQCAIRSLFHLYSVLIIAWKVSLWNLTWACYLFSIMYLYLYKFFMYFLLYCTWVSIKIYNCMLLSTLLTLSSKRMGYHMHTTKRQTEKIYRSYLNTFLYYEKKYSCINIFMGRVRSLASTYFFVCLLLAHWFYWTLPLNTLYTLASWKRMGYNIYDKVANR